MAELHEAIAGLCVVIQRIFRSYQVSRLDPCNLDLLIYQVSKLLGILIAVTYCSDQVLSGCCWAKFDFT